MGLAGTPFTRIEDTLVKSFGKPPCVMRLRPLPQFAMSAVLNGDLWLFVRSAVIILGGQAVRDRLQYDAFSMGVAWDEDAQITSPVILGREGGEEEFLLAVGLRQESKLILT
jgi:uncharacterized protein YcgL (UPF0745 family)